MTTSVAACELHGFPPRQGAARAAREDVQAPGRGRGGARPGRALDRARRSARTRSSRSRRRPSTTWRSSRARRSSSRRGSRCARRSTPKDYCGRRAHSAAGDGDRRAGHRGARGLPPPADRVQAGRGAHRDRRHRRGAGRGVTAGRRAQAQAQARSRSISRTTPAARCPGLAEPAAREADRRRAESRSSTRCGRGLRRRELAGQEVDLHVTIKEAREKKVPALDDEMAKDTGEAETLEGLRDKMRERLLEDGRAADQARDDAAR